MYTHRTNVLLSEEENQLLTKLSVEKKVTKSELIRVAIRKTYAIKKQHEMAAEKKRRELLLQELKSAGKKIKYPSKPFDWKEMRDHGRKY